jgi:LysR family cys regulon transcriptional activator
MAYNETVDSDLVALDASHLFQSSVTKLGFRRGTFLRGFMYDFIEKFAPHLTKDIVNEAFNRHSKAELDELFEDITLPSY